MKWDYLGYNYFRYEVVDNKTVKIETKVSDIDKINYGVSQYEHIASIVHQGNTATSGHYVAFVTKCHPDVMKYDDLGSERGLNNHQKSPSYGPATEEFQTKKMDSYILLYKKIQRLR